MESKHYEIESSFQLLSQFHILVVSPRPLRQLPTHPPYRLRHPSSRPDEAPGQPIDDANGDENAEDVAHHAAFASTGVEEAVRVEALGGDGDVGKCEVECEDHDEEWEMEHGRGVGAEEEDFEEC